MANDHDKFTCGCSKCDRKYEEYQAERVFNKPSKKEKTLKELKSEMELAKERYEKAIEKFQEECEHDIEVWRDYSDRHERCRKCDKWF